MSSNSNHINLKRIKDYFDGKLSAKEMHTLEMEAQNDPFLYEAMEGYEAHPDGLIRVNELINKHGSEGGLSAGYKTLAIIGGLALVYAVIVLVTPPVDDSKTSQINVTERAAVQEVEVIPESIDTFEIAELDQQIRPEEIVVNKPLIEKSNEEQQEPNKNETLPDLVDISEEQPIVYDETLVPEEANHSKVVYAPSTYMYDLYVVDYTRIKRPDNVITYMRRELTGLSAEFENDLARDRHELIEKEVEIPYVDYLERSMKFFAVEDYKKALNRFLTILEQYPKDLNAHFYGALCYFDMKQYDTALAFFDNIIRYELERGFIAFRQEAKWYKVKTLLKLNRKSEAIPLLEEIIAEGLFYVQDAIELKERL